jgi:malate dehydrogenase (oxaloacetate-decarboxylating)(NADP+)
MIRRDESLEYHAGHRAGKIELRATKPCLTAREMRLGYLPGATFACEAIAEDPERVFRYTARGNLVAVVTNGSAVPGLGAIGPLASKPMQEGLAILFKQLADIDVFDLELDTDDPDKFVETVRLLEPGFGAIVLKDVRAPEGLSIYEQLAGELHIPVFHENLQHRGRGGRGPLERAGAGRQADRQCAHRHLWRRLGRVGCARLFAMGVDPEGC